MGGGLISKDKFISKDTGGPKNIFNLSHDKRLDWIYGGSFPGYKSTFDYLQNVGIKLIITLTIEPIKSGRNINHVPHSHDDTEWMDSDLDDDDLQRFKIIHIPIADTGFPTITNANRLLQTITTYRLDHPKSKVYFHCWLELGRTCTSIIYILMKTYNMTYNEAYSNIQRQYKLVKVGMKQFKFLNSIAFTNEDIINSQPTIKTPKNHECYKGIIYSKKKKFDTDNDSGSFADNDNVSPLDSDLLSSSSTDSQPSHIEKLVSTESSIENNKDQIFDSLNDLRDQQCRSPCCTSRRW